ncbi:MAG: hypothetical protein QXJ51_01720 [Sulfolobales archaeon]
MIGESEDARVIVKIYGVLRDTLGWSEKIFRIEKGISLKEFLEREVPEIIDYIEGESQQNFESDRGIILLVGGVITPLKDINKIMISRDLEIEILPSIIGG